MNAKWYVQKTAAVLLCLLAVNGCGNLQDTENLSLSAEKKETGFTEGIHQETLDEESRVVEDSLSETLQEMPTEENGVMEIYANGDIVPLSGDTMVARVSPQKILAGNPIIYDRFSIDGWVFEWMISDSYDDDDWFLEDGVLVVTHEDDAEDAQIIHVQAKGGYATWVSAENKFEYVDVNFDALPDLLICTGHHGNQGLITYYCFLQTENGFVESPTFTDILNPAIDSDNKLILSQWRNSAASHGWGEYKYEDNTYTMCRMLCEKPAEDSDGEVWVWEVNGQEIGRSDELSASEIEDLLYNENSEWRISEDRWQTLYNKGLMINYSIYNEP